VAEQAASEADNLVNTSQLTDTSFLYDANIADLENATSYMDGQTVQVSGEVVGDCITSEYNNSDCWITLQSTDGSFSEVAVYMTKSQARIIDSYGCYDQVGTQLQVRGTLYTACADHEGTTEIHAVSVALVSSGYANPQSIKYGQLGLGLGLVLLGTALYFGYQYMRNKMR
jgi:hypothetical protein